MNKVSLSVDYSVIQQCESKVDASFRRLRMSRFKFKKQQSESKETYLRRILDVHRKKEAEERALSYNKRLKTGQKETVKPGKSEGNSSDEEGNQPIEEQSPYEENKESSGSSPLSVNFHENDSDSDFFSSPYHRYDIVFTRKNRGQNRGKSERNDTEVVLEVDDDLMKDYQAGKITKGEYRKVMLFRKKMIHCVCLEDLDREKAGRDWGEVEKESREMREKMEREMQKHPKAYALAHPRRKVTTSYAESIAFRPHPALTARPSPVKSPPVLPHSPSSRPQSIQSKRPVFYNRPVTASGGLGPGTYLKQANPKHGGRLSAQNMNDYLLNRMSKLSQRRHKDRQPVSVLTAMRRAAARVSEVRGRFVPHSEVLRLRGLSALVRSGHSIKPMKVDRFEVGLDIPSRLDTERSSDVLTLNSEKLL